MSKSNVYKEVRRSVTNIAKRQLERLENQRENQIKLRSRPKLYERLIERLLLEEGIDNNTIREFLESIR